MTGGTDDRVWEKGWDGHQIEQLRRLAALSFPDKLRWLEEAERAARHLSRATAEAMLEPEARSLEASRSPEPEASVSPRSLKPEA